MLLRDGGPRDLPYIADFAVESFRDDEITKYLALYRDQYPITHRDHYLYRSRRLLNSGARLTVAVDGNQSEAFQRDRIVGFALWSNTLDQRKEQPLSVVDRVSAKFESFMLQLEGYYRAYINVDKSIDTTRQAAFRASLIENPFFEHIPDYWELEIMAVRASHQRRGIGSRLLLSGMQQAKSDGVPAVVAATESGRKLYAKHGFEKCGSMDLDGVKSAWTAMIWQP